MNLPLSDLVHALPEIFLLVMVCVVLLADLVAGEKNRHVAYLLTQFALFGSALITIQTFTPDTTYAFSGLFVDDVMADMLKLLVVITVSTLLVYSRAYIAVRGIFSG